MSSISRRSLLGYSGTAAAGALVGTTAPAQQAEAAESATETASTEFPEGTVFSGWPPIAFYGTPKPAKLN
ncbi:twin-arginine translocation signal domain-containing protein [Streptomyces sp. NPDC056660]|uniref:twin-arginine translocation signal domain-containing protein n=1 Tax=Streptomyces sp. NPDC056660 TaxID=3345897 RepID=UPI00369F4BAE